MREVVVWNTFNKRIQEWLHYYVVHSSLSIAWSTSFVWCYSLNCSQRLQLWWKNNWNVLFRCMLLLVCCLMMQIPWLLWWNLRKHHKSHMLILVDWINRYRKSRYFADNSIPLSWDSFPRDFIKCQLKIFKPKFKKCFQVHMATCASSFHHRF